MQKSLVTHRAPTSCNVLCAAWYEGDSSAIKFDRVEIAFILALLYWLKPLTDEVGEETGALGEYP